MNTEELLKRSEYVFGKHDLMLPLWQEIADNFYVERADFTTKRSWGVDFASHLTTSFPLAVRRDLGDQISAMTRPRGEQWVEVSVDRDENLGVEAKQKLEAMTKTQFRAMYDRPTNFIRATKEADHDFASFGQAVITPDINWKEQALCYQTWHLRDVAWVNDITSRVCEVHHKWKPTINELKEKFGGKIHPKLIEKGEKEPYCEVEVRRIVIRADQYYGAKEVKGKYLHITIDVENKHVMEEVQKNIIGYVIPRWMTVSGSQYAHSPCTVIALPDARLIQAMTLSMLEAGEMAVRPPLLAASDSIREDIQYFAGGITKADVDNDRQLKDVLAPIFQDKSGYSFGLEMTRETKEAIVNAFYINKLSLPPSSGKETAYEISQRVQQYIRQALPLFEPLEDDYNGQLCEQTFELLMSVGAFGRPDTFPRELQGANVRFKFNNPLQEAIEAKSTQKWREAVGLVMEGAQLDPSLIGVIKPHKGLRDALEGNKTPMAWMTTEDEMAAYVEQTQKEAQQQKSIAMAGQVAEVAETAGKANKELENAA